MARVYAGFFRWKDRRIPMVTVVKCGATEEQGKPKPGNRGKRDSQLILMNFFSRVVYNDRMTPLDYDLFRKIQYLMGVTPDFFEIGSYTHKVLNLSKQIVIQRSHTIIINYPTKKVH